MAELNMIISTITLKACGLNTPIKRQRLPDWMKKHDPNIGCLQDTHFKYKKTGLPWWSSGKESALQCRGQGVRSLVRELRSHMLQGS